jgi:flagellum-specific peptidoglycan hydrolase FlgJ
LAIFPAPKDWHSFGTDGKVPLICLHLSAMLLSKIGLILLSCLPWNPPERLQPYVLRYIEQYKYIAIDEMERSGIPASIIIAQAIVETNAGTSRLAQLSNNHFGIKCKDYWEGETFYSPDDDHDKNGNIVPSCFRQYRTPVESYRDHTDFLMQTDHYQGLFGYDKTDYVLWAKGLQLCGYASDQQYAEKLITTIRTYGLDELDYYTVELVERSALENHDLVMIPRE